VPRYRAMKCEACEHENIEGARFCAGCGALMPAEAGDGEDPLVGQVVGGRYRITGVLGEGGMGVVYVAEQQMGSTVRKVAVKTLHPQLSKDPSVLARFHRECGTVAQLEHPNTIKFYDFGATSDGTLYIAMEFVKGTPLDQVIEHEGPLPPERTLKITKQICGALDEAHRQGIVHRDLKPENIILTNRAGEADTVKVLDFGIAARSESADAQKEQKLTQQGMVLGTPPYMSPEQFTGKALDLRSDIYSLGVMAYEMLTGRLPFDADTPWQWATQHMTAQPRPFEASAPSATVAPQMRNAIMKALSKDRDERPESAQAFYAELSSGGGLTVDEPVPSSFTSAGTAAMTAVPDFSVGGVSPMAGPPPAQQVAPVQQAASPMVAPAMAPAMPMAPPPARSGGGGFGKLVIGGLVAVGGLLAVAFVVVLLKTMKPADDTDGPLANPFDSAGGGEIEIAPQTSGAETATESASLGTATEKSATAASTGTSAPASGGGSGQTRGGGGGTGQTRGGGGGTSTTNPPAQGGTTGGTRPDTGGGSSTSPPPSSGAACDACISAARSGNVVGASAKYSQCDDGAKKARCSQVVRSKAIGAARTAALNGRCTEAKAIIAAAKRMGAGSGPLDGALNGTSCR